MARGKASVRAGLASACHLAHRGQELRREASSSPRTNMCATTRVGELVMSSPRVRTTFALILTWQRTNAFRPCPTI
jgi:hypothetical protein